MRIAYLKQADVGLSDRPTFYQQSLAIISVLCTRIDDVEKQSPPGNRCPINTSGSQLKLDLTWAVLVAPRYLVDSTYLHGPASILSTEATGHKISQIAQSPL